MKPAFYRTLLCVLLMLSLSGVIWMVLHYFFPASTEFGTAPNLAEPPSIRIHGIVAVATVFLLGGVATSHVVAGWNRAHNQPSGLVLAGLCIALILSGYALYYITADSVRSAVAIAHQVAGIAGIAAALFHWKRKSR
jgi:hypothetical protein